MSQPPPPPRRLPPLLGEGTNILDDPVPPLPPPAPAPAPAPAAPPPMTPPGQWPRRRVRRRVIRVKVTTHVDHELLEQFHALAARKGTPMYQELEAAMRAHLAAQGMKNDRSENQDV